MATAREMAEEAPPVVMINEAEFVENNLEPAFEEVKATLADGIEVMDKVQVKSIMEKATKRELVQAEDGTETGGITDEEFEPFFA